MKLKKLLHGLGRTGRVVLAGCLTAVTVLTVWAGVTYFGSRSTPARPTVRFRCMDFKLVEDGSIQALVRLSIENVPKFSGVGFNIEYNPYYIQPSYLTPDGKKQVLVSGNDGSSTESWHYTDDEAIRFVKLKNGTTVTPFATEASTPGFVRDEVVLGTLDTDGSTKKNGKIRMSLELEQALQDSYASKVYSDGTLDVAQVMDIGGHAQGSAGFLGPEFLYIDASGEVKSTDGRDDYVRNEGENADSSKGYGYGAPGHGVNLGSITFWVDPDHLTEMVTKFNASEGFLIGYPNKEDKDKTKADPWYLSEMIPSPRDDSIYITNKRNPMKPGGMSNEPGATEAQVIFEFIFPKALMKAEVAGGRELTVNAYQAFVDGKLSDIAATVQRYRSEITGTCADATETNYVFDWGDKTPVTTPGGGDYKVYRRYSKETDTGAPDYVDRLYKDDLSESDKLEHYWTEIGENDPYDPRGGEYLVTQYFWYEEDGELKKYPLRMEVLLTVTPVNLVDATATDLSKTYTVAQVTEPDSPFVTGKSSLSALELPRQALLALSPVPGSITLTMPITAWKPGAIENLKTDDTSNPQEQNWPAEGVYTLKGPETQDIIDYVQGKNNQPGRYPWLTVSEEFEAEIVATRKLVDVEAHTEAEYQARWVSTTVNGDGSSELSLQVTKTKGGDYQTGTQFKTYLPGGAEIDVSDKVKGLPYSQNGSVKTGNNAYSAYGEPGGRQDATLVYAPGTNMSPADRSEHQEDVSRAVNLGGWFYVSVGEEPDDSGERVWSELIPVYVPPRTNYYEPSQNKDIYIHLDNGPQGEGAHGKGHHYYFDFTGPKAGLYPFYSDSVLPTSVVLPIGYSVTTTFDGFTGIEPGQLGEFPVEEWVSAEEDDEANTHSAHTAPTWCSEAVIHYGYGQPNPDPTGKTPAYFKDAVYAAFGAVENHHDTKQLTTGGTTKTVTDHKNVSKSQQVRVSVQAPEYAVPSPTPEEPEPTPGPVDQPKESIRLIYEPLRFKNENHSGVSTDASGEVLKTTYKLQQEGYVDREIFTLTIENNGDTDIYGLSVDLLNGKHSPAYQPDPDAPGFYDEKNLKNHFEILVPPASYLPAGGKTTFVVTYVYNLTDNNPGPDGTTYEDHLIITSNNYNDIENGSYLKDYIANFEVTGSAIYQVTVVTRPAEDMDGDGNPDYMGKGNIVVGVGGTEKPTTADGKPTGTTVSASGAAKKPDLDTTTDTYVAEHRFVWIDAEPYDENKVKSVYYIDGQDENGEDIRVLLDIYRWQEEAGKPETDVYFFEMPARDVTVVVEFYEPIYAKLRLSRLMGYTGKTNDALLDTETTALISDEREHKVRWYADSKEVVQDNLLYGQSAVYQDTDNVAGGGTVTVNVMAPEDSSRHPDYAAKPPMYDYVMVLGDYANTPNKGQTVDEMALAQLRLRLRKNCLAPDVDKVEVEFFKYDLVNNQSTNYQLNVTEEGETWHGTTDAPTYHNSYAIPIPAAENGEIVRVGVEIRLSCELTPEMIAYDPAYQNGQGQPGDKIQRSFVVVIVRPAKEITSQFNYGNSPKGMIYNNTKLTDADKQTAWTEFVEGGNRFDAVSAAKRPSAATGLDNTYWLEAWGKTSYQGVDNTAKTNADRDEYALFILLGEDFQDPGFAKLQNTAGLDVKPEDILRTAEVEQLKADAKTQALRFHGLRNSANANELVKATLDLGTGDKGLVTNSGDVISEWWKISEKNEETNVTTVTSYPVRPGVYKLTYTFPDYDGTTPKTVVRPLIILAPVGDVNADGKVESSGAASDVDYIQNRVQDPLGGMSAVNGYPNYPAWLLMRYRSTDSNNDRNVNNIDANQILHHKDELTPYYKPTDYISK